MALCFMEFKSENPDKNELEAFSNRYNVMAKLSPLEKSFALNEDPSESQRRNANWRAEGFHVLLWALGFVDRLDFPAELCNLKEDLVHLFSRSEPAFRDAAVLRSATEILDQADLALRLNWACVNAKTKNQPVPGTLNRGVVYERHYAFNWLINYRNQEWDDVSTDT